MEKNNKLDAYAAKILPGLFEVEDFSRIYQSLQEADARFKDVTPDTFGVEFLCLRLAMACKSWEKACGENGMKDEAVKKILLKRIMNSFQSPKFLKMATAFSGYLYSENAEAHPEIGLPEQLFKNLNMETRKQSSGKEEPADAFQLIVGVCSSMRNSFENEFFESIHRPE
jgi:hypothetical protein